MNFVTCPEDVQHTIRHLLTSENVADMVEILWFLSENHGMEVTPEMVFHLFLFWGSSPKNEPVDILREGWKSPYAPFVSHVWNMYNTYYVSPEHIGQDLVKTGICYLADHYCKIVLADMQKLY